MQSIVKSLNGEELTVVIRVYNLLLDETATTDEIVVEFMKTGEVRMTTKSLTKLTLNLADNRLIQQLLEAVEFIEKHFTEFEDVTHENRNVGTSLSKTCTGDTADLVTSSTSFKSLDALEPLVKEQPSNITPMTMTEGGKEQ